MTKSRTRLPRTFNLAFVLSISVGLLGGDAIVRSQDGRTGGFPSPLDSYLATTVRPTVTERKRLMSGGPITKLLDADASTEVAVFGAVWINAATRRYVDAVESIETFERGGGFKLTKRISSPPALADFDRLRLPEDDVKDLRSCRVGEVQLPNGTSFLYWQETEFGLKPTIRINHLTIREAPDSTVVASKMLYASHYFWTALELRVLLPDELRRIMKL